MDKEKERVIVKAADMPSAALPPAAGLPPTAVDGKALLKRLLYLRSVCWRHAYKLCASARGQLEHGTYNNLLADVVPDVVEASGASGHIICLGQRLAFLGWLQCNDARKRRPSAVTFF